MDAGLGGLAAELLHLLDVVGFQSWEVKGVNEEPEVFLVY